MKFSNYHTHIKNVLIVLFVNCVYIKSHDFLTSSEFSDSVSNPLFLNSEELLVYYKYPSERLVVITEDGYILNLFRIPKRGPPVLLVHGIGDSSDSWLVLGPTDSLAYMLADAGFDVWLYNSRGNKYSKSHTKNVTEKQYWNFSYEEMGSKDLPAVIDNILLITAREKLSYIGFSQGTTIFFVMGSMIPEYNAKIQQAILLAPVAWLTNLQFPFLDLLSNNLKMLTKLFEHKRLYEIFSNNSLRNLYHAKACKDSSPAKVLCDIEYFFNYGLKNSSYLPPEKFPVIASHIPAGSSTKTLAHFIQGYASRKFRRYNYYGAGDNARVYGSSVPPDYNVSLVDVPVTLMVSESDRFSSVGDVKRLRSKLPNVSQYVVFNKSLDFSHIEYIYGSRARTLVNEPVIRLLQMTNQIRLPY